MVSKSTDERNKQFTEPCISLSPILGIGFSLQAASTHLKHKKQKLIASALESFHKAQQSDPNDHLSEYYLALQYAQGSQIPEAMCHVKMALNLRP
ncbi:hypothetical protein R5R35_008549 [Gryllus longicercus]|uniref:Uncharacterized protein n=1 Tax=Gryllus longicercus TaxID=2509291 RepID=A0AAN9Z7U9_9ORTH